MGPIRTHVMKSEHDRLAERIRLGDAAALDQLFERHLPALRAFIHLNMGAALRRKETTEDLAQSTCRQLLQTMEAFEYEGERAFRVYLYRAALHKIYGKSRYYAAQRRAPERETELASSALTPEILEAYRSISSPSHHLMRAEEIERVRQAFDQLAPEEREVLSMKRLLGLSVEEIADKLDIDREKVRWRLGQALAKLARLIGRTVPEQK
jgi:RNA polymerase sigma-70 factor, ECF subfamily